MPRKNRLEYNAYQREYRRKRRQEDQDFLRKEIDRSREYWGRLENRERRAEWQRNKAQRRKKRLDWYKEKKGCSMCGFSGPAYCFDFHHVDGEDKDFTIARVYAGVSLKKLFLELRKCILVCSNCHRKIHGGHCGS